MADTMDGVAITAVKKCQAYAVRKKSLSTADDSR
jgi:hypothetical protein